MVHVTVDAAVAQVADRTPLPGAPRQAVRALDQVEVAVLEYRAGSVRDIAQDGAEPVTLSDALPSVEPVAEASSGGPAAAARVGELGHGG